MVGTDEFPFACDLIFISSTIPPCLVLTGGFVILGLGVKVVASLAFAASFLSILRCSSLFNEEHV